MNRASRLFLILFLILLSPPIRLQAQDQARLEGMLVGVSLGRTSSRLLWSGTFSSEKTPGVSVGAFMEVPTPLPHFSMRADGMYMMRSSLVWNPQVDPEREGESEVRSHYLSFSLDGKLFLGAGPVSLYAFAGPALDILLDTGCRADFCPFLREETPTTLGVAVGSGGSVRLGEGLELGLEIRLTEVLSAAYQTQDLDARWRTVEILLRAGLWR